MEREVEQSRNVNPWKRIFCTMDVDGALVHNQGCLSDTQLLVLLPTALEKGIGIVNGSPFASGLLTDRGAPSWQPSTLRIRASPVSQRSSAEIRSLVRPTRGAIREPEPGHSDNASQFRLPGFGRTRDMRRTSSHTIPASGAGCARFWSQSEISSGIIDDARRLPCRCVTLGGLPKVVKSMPIMALSQDRKHDKLMFQGLSKAVASATGQRMCEQASARWTSIVGHTNSADRTA
jgi:hypothetical protein